MALPPYANETYTDFTRKEAREAMLAAIERVKGELGGNYPLILGGKPVETEDEITSIDPAEPQQIVGHAGRASRREADMALDAATRAFEGWSRTAPQARSRILLRAAAGMRRRKLEFIAWEVFEGGKPWAEADAQVCEAIDFLEYYAREMLRLADGAPVGSVPGEENRYFYRPMGVGVIIAPWNFPTAILTGMTSAALVTGNTVVMKPSENTSVIAAKVAEVFEEAGLPPGVLNYCPGRGSEIGDYLVGDSRTRFISFTGSMQTGLRINELAAKPNGQPWVKRVLAEMGGKDAMIIDESADLDAAAADIVASAYAYAGQKCSACSRLIIHSAVYDEVLEDVAAKAGKLKVGPTHDDSSYYGPVISREQFDKVTGYIETGKQEGNLVTGGLSSDLGEGYFVHPTIFEASPQARIAREEIFGPVLTVMTARDFDEALAIANDTPYALTGGVYSRDRDHLERARYEFQAGNLYFNRKITGSLVGVQPFGGYGLSGTDAKAGGPDYLRLHMVAKSVTERF